MLCSHPTQVLDDGLRIDLRVALEVCVGSHDGPRQNLRMSAETRSVFERASDIAGAKSQLFSSAEPLAQHFSFFGRGRWVLSAPSIQRSKEEYCEFIDAVLLRVSGGLRSSLAHATLPSAPVPGDVDPIAPVIQISRGHDLPRPR